MLPKPQSYEVSVTPRLRALLAAALLAAAFATLPGTLAAQKPRTKPAPGVSTPTAAVTPAPTSSPAAVPVDRARAFAAADAHADATPATATQSVAPLAAYLARSGSDQLTRSRALYRWLAGNIAYNADGLRTGNYGDVSPEGVLRSRSSVCEGYARLGEALGTAMGLEIQVVSGWSKGYGYTTGQRFDGPTNHAWNAVRVDGAWRLMDPTWGAGYLDQQMRFVRRFQEHYFLTAPEAFVFDHLPQDPRWQLLERPVSAEEYVDLVHLRPTFFLAGLRLGSHLRARIAADDRVAVTLGVTQPVQMMGQLVDPASNRRVEGEFAFVQVSDSSAQVLAAFPRAGDYVLRLFAKPRGAEGQLSWVLDYRVQAARGAPDAVFPFAYEGFSVTGATLVEPFSGVLRAGQTYRFRLRAPGALDVAVVAGSQWTHLAQSGGEFAGDVVAAAGNVTVYAKYDPTSNFTGLLRYTGR